MTLEIFLASLRHGLTALGVYVTAWGVTDVEGWTAVSGAIITIVGFGWSVWRKYDRKARTGSPS
jgi:ABC-type nickel/cobalt efflux system permease component RcnA